MPFIEIYTKRWCPYCIAAKKLLDQQQLPYEEIHVEDSPSSFESMAARSQRRTVPQIFIADTHVGGADDLLAAHRSGKLVQLVRGVLREADELQSQTRTHL